MLTKPGFFDAVDGVKLYCDWYLPAKKARAAVLLIHGYADHSARYSELGEHLAVWGFAVLAFDYRGHGQAGGRRGHCDRFGEFVSDLDCALARLRAAFPDIPLVALSHSHGALIVLRALCEKDRQTDLSAAILASPYLGLAMRVSPLKIAVGKLASRLFPRLTLRNEIDPKCLSHDPSMVEKRASDRFCHGVATARWFTEATSAQEYVFEHAEALSIPTLWLVAGGDPIADPLQSRLVYERAGGEKQLVTYEGLFHELFHETERGKVFEMVRSWLSQRFPGA